MEVISKLLIAHSNQPTVNSAQCVVKSYCSNFFLILKNNNKILQGFWVFQFFFFPFEKRNLLKL